MKDLYDLTGYMDRNSKNGTHKFYIALVEKLLMQYKINIDGFAGTNAKDMYYKVMADHVHYFKEDEKGWR